MRGQVNLVLLALLCCMIAALLQGQSWRAGFWLAAAICLKVIPAFLLLIPLCRRDARCLAACALGVMLGFVGVPTLVFGPARTADYYQEYARELLGPALGQGPSTTRAREIIDMTANDSQSLQAAIHNTLNLDRATRPATPAPVVRRAHWLAGGLLTLLTLLAAGVPVTDRGSTTAVWAGALMVNMLLLSPVCHLHYFCLALPLVMGLLASSWEQAPEPRLGASLMLLLAGYFVTLTLPNLQGLEVVRDLAGAMYGALALWAAGCILLLRARRHRGRQTQRCVAPSVAA
jgi:hypothetical protein